MSADGCSKWSEIRSYLTGYGLALILTGAAFAAVQRQRLATGPTLALLFVLALVQVIVHFRFFLHIRFGRSSRDTLQLVLFSALIIALMVAGTLVILFNLRARMM